MRVNRNEAIRVLAKNLGFRLTDGRVEFVSFTVDIEGKEKIIVRAVHPVDGWQVKLWDECIVLIQQVMALQFESGKAKLDGN